MAPLSSRPERSDIDGFAPSPCLLVSVWDRKKWDLDPIDLLALSTLCSRRLSLRPVITIPIQGRVAA